MIKTYFLSIACCLVATVSLAQTKLERLQFIELYKNIAVQEMSRTGIPASIKLAQACVETGYGTSTLARKAYNYFGMKCGREWLGDTYYVKDDDFDENGKLVESCFRRYDSPEASIVAHSEFLRDPNKSYRYGFLFRLEPKDYKRWAQGLYQAGYATNPNYANLLINTIEEYQLFKYDEMSPGSVQSVTDIVLVNDAKMVLAKAGETPTELAARYNVKVKCLLKFNEKLRGPNQPLTSNAKVFIQKKRRFFRGKQNVHFVQPGETMYAISQLYGVRLSKLYSKNRMEEGSQPAINEKLSLRGRIKRGTMPKLRDAQDDEDNNAPVINNGDKLLDIDNSTVVKPSDLPEPSNTPNANSGNNSSTNTGATPNSGTNNNGNSTTNNNGTTNSNTSGTGWQSTGTSSSPNPDTNTNGTNGSEWNSGGTVIVTDVPATPTPQPKKPKKPKPAAPKKTDSVPSGSTTVPSTTKPTGTTPSTTVPSTKPTSTTSPSSTPPSTVPATTPTGTGAGTTIGTTNNSSVEGAIYYSVATGDTMYSVAKKFSTTVESIQTLNKLTTTSIRPGQFLRVK